MKQGDKVKVICEKYHFYNVGDVVEIVEVLRDGYLKVLGSGDFDFENIVLNNQIELIK